MSTSSITFPVSDGDPSHRPPPNSRHVIATREAQANYRAKVGNAIAKDLDKYRPGMAYILKSLPEGYEFYERPRPPGGGTVLVDRYLFGHPSHYVFLSTCEFMPHARWLATNRRGTCSCFGCNGGRTKSTKSTKRKRSRPAAPRPTAARPATSRPATSKSATSRSVKVLIENSPLPSPKRERVTNEPLNAIQSQEGLFFTKLFTDLKTGGNLDVPINQRENIKQLSQDRNFNLSPTTVSSQGAFVPRRGELVLYLSSAHISSRHPNTDGPHQTKSTDAQPVWKAGFVTQLPHYLLPPLELSDITEPNPGSSAVGIDLAGFRVQTMCDFNFLHSEQQLPMEYLPLNSLRPFCFHEEILSAANTPRSVWHPSIFNALRASASFSLASPAHFTGTWPDAQILYDGVFFGGELILVGDVVRIAPPLQSPASPDKQTETHAFKINALKVTSIVLTFEGLTPDSDPKPDDHDGPEIISRQPSSGSRNAETGVASFVDKAPSQLQDVATSKRLRKIQTRQSPRSRLIEDPPKELQASSSRQDKVNEKVNEKDAPPQTDSAPSNRVTGENCKQIRLRLHGKLFTRSPILPDRNAQDVVIAVNNSHIPPVLQASDGHWVPVDSPYKIHSAPLSQVLGRFYEDEAVMRYGIIPEPQAAMTAGEDAVDLLSLPQSSLIAPVDLGVSGIQSGREYARDHHEWLVKERESGRSKSKKLWFWGNDRVDGLFGKGDETEEDVGQRWVDGWVKEERGDDGRARLLQQDVVDLDA